MTPWFPSVICLACVLLYVTLIGVVSSVSKKKYENQICYVSLRLDQSAPVIPNQCVNKIFFLLGDFVISNEWIIIKNFC